MMRRWDHLPGRYGTFTVQNMLSSKITWFIFIAMFQRFWGKISGIDHLWE